MREEAVEDGIEQNGEESPSLMIYRNSLNARHLAARSGKRGNLAESPQNPFLEAAGIDTVAVSSCKQRGLGQSAQSGGVKSGVICENLENEPLSDVVSAWSFLPPHIRDAILLLVRQYVQ